MATKKTKDEAPEELKTEQEAEQEQEAPAEEPVKQEAPYDPWTDMVDVLMPRFRAGEDQTIRVKVNDREVILPKDGRTHKVARPWAEILLANIEQELKADAFMDENMTGEREIARM